MKTFPELPDGMTIRVARKNNLRYLSFCAKDPQRNTSCYFGFTEVDMHEQYEVALKRLYELRIDVEETQYKIPRYATMLRRLGLTKVKRTGYDLFDDD